MSIYQPLPKWRRNANRPSFLDLLTLLRKEMAENPALLASLGFKTTGNNSDLPLPPETGPAPQSKCPKSRRRLTTGAFASFSEAAAQVLVLEAAIAPRPDTDDNLRSWMFVFEPFGLKTSLLRAACTLKPCDGQLNTTSDGTRLNKRRALPGGSSPTRFLSSRLTEQMLVGFSSDRIAMRFSSVQST